jgi:methionyl-tRNA formyltransferase
MKFIILCSGQIAKSFFSDFGVLQLIQKGLLGIVSDEDIRDLFILYHKKIGKKNIIKIGGKSITEKKIKLMIERTRPDFLLSLQYPWILSKSCLDLIPNMAFNFHNASLPHYRGHNAISHIILNEETRHTLTIHRISFQVDRGNVIVTKKIKINKNDTAWSLWNRSRLAAILLITNFLKYPEEYVYKKGDDISKGGRYYKKNDIFKYKKIPPKIGFDEIDKIARAFWFPPKEPAFFIKGRKKIYAIPKRPDYKLG